jgi:DNA-binding MarR family transcriptional regulator
MGALIEATRQSGGTITGIVDRLIADGLVARAHIAGDRRVVEVTLTPAGEQRARQVIDARHADMCRILERFNDSQLADFEQLLRLFTQSIQDDLARHAPQSAIEA